MGWLWSLPVLLLAAVALRLASMRAAARNLGRLTHDAAGVIVGAEPIDRPRRDAPAVLLIHGFGDTPQTLTYLADDLAARGYAVRGPLLSGHGRSVGEFAASRAEEWLSTVLDEYRRLRASHREVVLCGLSMGGALAAIAAVEDAEPRALVMIAPYLAMPHTLRLLTATSWLWSPFLPYLAAKASRSILDPVENARNLAFRVSTPRAGHQLSRLVARARGVLPLLTAPVLTVQSRTDNRIAAPAALAAFDLVGSADKTLRWVTGCAHIITVDYCRDEVFETIGGWLAARVAATAPGGDRTAPSPAAPL